MDSSTKKRLVFWLKICVAGLGLAVLVFAGSRLFKTSLNQPITLNATPTQTSSCRLPKFTLSPINPTNIDHIVPMGRMFGPHVTPTDHIYIIHDENNGGRYPVYALTDGQVIQAEKSSNVGANFAPRGFDYGIWLDYGCGVKSGIGHLAEFATGLAQTVGDKQFVANLHYPVKKGDIIGYTGSRQCCDLSLSDENVTLPGLINQQTYEREWWKLHAVDPFGYFDEPIRSQLLVKNIRTVPPLGGKIDYDTDGTLLGNWYKQGTNGYKGLDNDQAHYYKWHAAFAYNHVDPKLVEISLGNFIDAPSAFFVKGNGPDPKDVTPEIGLVKYELLHFGWADSKTGVEINEDFMHVGDYPKVFDTSTVGTVLIQLLPKRELKLEIFPDKTASQVDNFTSKALLYER
jgi:hypothetical protein